MKSVEKKRMLFKILILLLLFAFLGVNSYAVDVVDDNSTNTNSTSSDEINSDIAVMDATNDTPSNEAPETNSTPGSSTSGDSQNSGNADLTDFTNATFKVVKDGSHRARVNVTGATLKSARDYLCFITSTDVASPEMIDASDYSQTSLHMMERDNNGGLYYDITEYFELNQDLYAAIYEYDPDLGGYRLSFHGEKLERYAEPTYTDAFFATFLVNNDRVQIVTNFTSAGDRKLQIKIGKITNTSILQKIKNQDSSGFSDLLSFAKSSSGVYDQVVKSYSMSGIGYESTEGAPAINMTGLEDAAYYYLYVKPDDENGKYIPVEGITLTQCEFIGSSYISMHFYGDDDFQWADFGNVSGGGSTNGSNNGKEDPTTSKGDLPFTGKSAIITTSLIVLLVLLVYFKRKNDYFDGIK